jgi:aquaporin Z
MLANAASNRRLFAAEFIGSAVLILGGVGAAVLGGAELGTLGISLAFGLTLAVLVYSLGPISGAHLNPAVSIALWGANKLETAKLGVYLLAQFLGSLVGGLLLFAIAKGNKGFSANHNFAANGWGRSSHGRYDFWATVLVELVFTALLVMVYLATTHRSFPRSATGIAIGAIFALVYLVTMGVDGGGVNPARSLATAVFSGADAVKQVWAFLLFPILGGLLGVLAWLAVDEARLEDTRLDVAAGEVVRDMVS